LERQALAEGERGYILPAPLGWQRGQGPLTKGVSGVRGEAPENYPKSSMDNFWITSHCLRGSYPKSSMDNF